MEDEELSIVWFKDVSCLWLQTNYRKDAPVSVRISLLPHPAGADHCSGFLVHFSCTFLRRKNQKESNGR